MTWIKTVSIWDDERVKAAMEAQRKLYPQEYATPVPAVDHGTEAGIVASHTLLPDHIARFMRKITTSASQFTNTFLSH